jgi:hypothetical protein
MATSLLAFWIGGGSSAPALAGTKRVISARASTIPEGRTLTDVAWTIRTSGGAIVKQFNGPPDTPVVGVDLEGVYIEATVSSLPLTGLIELTITDSAGSVSSAELSF